MAEVEAQGFAAASRLAERIERLDEQRLIDKARVSAVHRNRASMIGDRCVRRLYLWRVAWREAAAPEPDLQAIFDEGNLHEDEVVRRLSSIGIRLRRAQVPFEWAGITGSIDGDCVEEDSGLPILVECKSISPRAWPRLHDADDFRNPTGSLAYVGKWLAQVVVYLFGSHPAYSGGVLVLKNKLTGRLKAIPVPLDYDYADALLRKSQRVDAAVRTGEPPPFLDDAQECQRCPFYGRACNPPLLGGDGARLITSAHLVEAAQVWQETRAAAAAHAEAADTLKDALRGQALSLVAGLEVQTQDVTVRLKAREATVQTQQRVSIRPVGERGGVE